MSCLMVTVFLRDLFWITARSLSDNGHSISAAIQRGHGSAPELAFEGERPFRDYFEYARWMIDQHLSLAVWPRETIVQDMHLEFDEATITALKCATCRVTGLDELVDDAARPVDCFVVEGLRVFLDNMTHQAAPDRS